MKSHVGRALLKTMTDMNLNENKDSEFAIALPVNHESLIDKIVPGLNILGIRVFLVSEKEVRIR